MRDPNYRPLTFFRRGGDGGWLSRAVGAAATGALLLLFATACSHNVDLNKPQSQDAFGVQMAKMNLWREAMFRFQRAVELNPGDAMAHNNLAVAYEANGDFDKAAKEYREALKLDRSNQYIQKNYSRYTEFMARNKKRQQRQEAKTAVATKGSATGSSTAAPATGTMIPPSTPEPAASGAAATAKPPDTTAKPPDTTAKPAATAAPDPSTTTSPAPATSTGTPAPATGTPATSTAPPPTAAQPPTSSTPPTTSTQPQTPPSQQPPPKPPTTLPSNPPGGLL